MDISIVLPSVKIIPVVTIDDVEDAIPLAETLYENGMKLIEITLRTEIALTAIHRIKEKFPSHLVAAGTVLNEMQVFDALEAGADIIISPGATITMLKATSDAKIPFLPGVTTCTEIATALEYEQTILKFFPANLAGGIKTLQTYSAVFPKVKFCPSGGINQDNANEYLSLNNVICVGGSWLTPKKLLQQKAWDEIGKLARQALASCGA